MTKKTEFQPPSPLGVPVDGNIVYIQFNHPFVTIPNKGKFSTADLVEKEQAKLEKYLAEKAKKQPNQAQLQNLLSQMVLPTMLAAYVSNNASSSSFKIVAAPDAPEAKQQAPKK